MHGMVVSVDIEAGGSEKAAKLLNEFTIPTARRPRGSCEEPGCSSDGLTGRGFVLFDTEEHVLAAAKRAKEIGPPPTIRSVEVLEVIAEA